MLIETGFFVSNSGDPRWQLEEGTGDRFFVQHVDFARPFRRPPDVQISLAGFQIGDMAKARLGTGVENATETGFDVRIVTWENSTVDAAHITWTAFGD